MGERVERQTRAGKLTFEVSEDWRQTRDLAGLRLTVGDACAVLLYPGHGLGAHELIVSADERYLALFLFSGQSEQGWELFELPSLKHLAGLPYCEGEGGPLQFSQVQI